MRGRTKAEQRMRLVLGAFLQATAGRGSNFEKSDSDSCHLILDFLYSCMARRRRLKPFILLNLEKQRRRREEVANISLLWHVMMPQVAD
jgi:hypothetical protein